MRFSVITRRRRAAEPALSDPTADDLVQAFLTKSFTQVELVRALLRLLPALAITPAESIRSRPGQAPLG
jgi:hypothetical protein